MFDDKKQFASWFGDQLDKGGGDEDEGYGGGLSESDMLAREKKLVVVHRLHQILLPFMLRRQVRGWAGGRVGEWVVWGRVVLWWWSWGGVCVLWW